MAPSVTASGITTDTVTGERHIPSSTRADGSQRREIRVRPGYRPPEDVELYKNRAAATFRNRGTARGGVPPGAEGLKSEGEATAQGSAGAAGTSSSKNAKKREAKRRAKEEGAGGGAATGATSSEGGKAGQNAPGSESCRMRANGAEGEATTAAAAAAAATVDPELEKEKKARNLKKKLRQAHDLRDKKDKGENLLPEQLEKVIKMQELIRQLDTLGFDAEGEKKNHYQQQQQQQTEETVDGDGTTAGKTDDNGAGV